jgi:peptidoglycan hydrolase-like protein with peptidoglycan-binding domain
MAGQPTVQWGSQGDPVVELQARLTAVGYATGGIDGQFGPVTDTAVRQFQADHWLESDGIVGPRTWAALDQVAGAEVPSPSAPPPEQLPSSHVVFVEEPAVSGLTLTYRAAPTDRTPLSAGAHIDGWSIETDGNPMVGHDTVRVPFADTADGDYSVALQLPDLAPGTYTVHVMLTAEAASSEVGHATFSV